jgi:hypothetical protein
MVAGEMGVTERGLKVSLGREGPKRISPARGWGEEVGLSTKMAREAGSVGW